MKVGYGPANYNSARNIAGSIAGVDYVEVNSSNRIVTNLRRATTSSSSRPPMPETDLRYSFDDCDRHEVDLLHFFNTISFGTTPWITTFETIVPRYHCTMACHHGRNCGYASLQHEANVLRGLEALAGKSCKTIIALSECNLNMQKDFLSHFPSFRSEIESKLVHLRPPQKVMLDSYWAKKLPLDKQIHFVFVGRAFFRKGGMQILEAFQELMEKRQYDLRLTIVSSMTLDNYATQETMEDVEKAQHIIRRNSDWILHRRELPNQIVVELMKTAHVGLLPTFADTYGYSVLEFQAAGCPVISTDVRALPEINNEHVGWIIKVPKNRLGEGLYTTTEDRMEMAVTIKEGLKRAVREILESSGVIAHKGAAALERVRNKHSPSDFAGRLNEIYQRSLE